MGGPRVTSGADSKQDYSTQSDFLASVEQRFGPIQFDLAAHAANNKHERYFAPPVLTKKKLDITTLTAPEPRRLFLESMVRQGAEEAEVLERLITLEDRLAKFGEAEVDGRNNKEVDFLVTNRDKKAYEFDALSDRNSWAAISQKFRSPKGGPGLLWLNCEFSDIEPWASKGVDESRKGGNTLLLTPVAISNWFRDLCAGVADVYLLSGRLCFDGKNVFPKDCMLSHFHPAATGMIAIWNWRKDLIMKSWEFDADPSYLTLV